MAYGRDITQLTYDVLAASDIGAYLKPAYAVSVKPNLVVPCPAWDGATTHPEVTEGILRFLKDFGVTKIKIIESAWVGDSTKRAWKECGYETLSKKYGVPLIDLKDDACRNVTLGELTLAVCEEALQTDFLINVPVLKAHSQTRMTCCMKNLKGCIPDAEKRRFHTLGLHKPIAALNKVIKTGYCVVDGVCGDLSFEEGGNPVTANRVAAGSNPLTTDTYCAELIGCRPDEIGYIRYGMEMGVGACYTETTGLTELNPEHKPLFDAKSQYKAERYRRYIEEDAACSACYSALIHAIHRLGGHVRVPGKVCVGQGFKGKSGAGFGVGNCARGLSACVPGCPPKATDIIAALG